MVDKYSTGVRVVTELAAEMKASIVALGGERSWGETRERWLEKAARSADISYRAAKCMFYGEDREPRASTVEKIRRAVAARQATSEALGVREVEELRARIAALEAALALPENRGWPTSVVARMQDD